MVMTENCDLLSASTESKPPLGVMPRSFWMEQRSVDLAEAIGRYATLEMMHRFRGKILTWVEELSELLRGGGP